MKYREKCFARIATYTLLLVMLTLYVPQILASGSGTRDNIATYTTEQLGTHYLWGAEGDKPLWKEYETWYGEDILGDKDVFLIQETSTAYQTKEGTPYPTCEVPPCKDIRHFDCSGLVYYVFKVNAGVSIGRLSANGYLSASAQYGDISVAEKGDLLFHVESGTAKHVGIVVDPANHYVIHASDSQHLVVQSQYAVPSTYWNKLGDLLSEVGNSTGVGGVIVQIDKLGLLAPYIGLASTILAATIVTTICIKRVKHRKEKKK